jgi:hypothetical protein
MRLFLDTEFNGFQGELLSMALVPEDPTKPEFYVELQFADQLDPWVKENVVPHMFELPLNRTDFQQKLRDYLYQMGPCTIVADWPDDIRHLCESLITGPGECLWPLHNILFDLDFNIKYNSEVPHNALWDARAIRNVYLENLK